MSTPFKSMKKGPVKDIVERELREFANSLDYWLDDYSSKVKSADPLVQEWTEVKIKLFRTIIEVAMAERGIEPREDYVS